MKGALLFITIFALLMLIIPMFAVNRAEPEQTAPPPREVPVTAQVSETEALPPDRPPVTPVEAEADIGTYDEEEPPENMEDDVQGPVLADVEEFMILDKSTGEVYPVPALDFIRGAVAAEMPAKFHPEALKAQAVAAHTYALYQHMSQQEYPDPSLKGADFSADPSNMLVFITEETAREFYGPKADEYWYKICQAADSVQHLALVYEDQPIVAAYHAISAGITEDAANVWVGGAPYLKPAVSEGDLLAPDYESELLVSPEEFKQKFLSAFPAMVFGEDLLTWIGATERSSSGYVTSIEIGGMELHGKDVREVLGLRSHNFDVIAADRGFSFVVYGYGHGVGLSQYGADFMARQGADFREILENYFSGAVLTVLAAEE